MTELISPTPVSSVDHDSGDVIERTSLGVELSAARKHTFPDASCADIAKQLNLSVHTIECLESDSFDELPPRLFVRGYVRAYAALLGLSVDHILRRFDVVYPPTPETVSAPSEPLSSLRVKHSYRVRRRMRTRGKRRWGRRLIILLVCVAAAVVVFRWVKNGADQPTTPGGIVPIQQNVSLSATPLVLRPHHEGQ